MEFCVTAGSGVLRGLPTCKEHPLLPQAVTIRSRPAGLLRIGQLIDSFS
jgi:hypothetical protein